MSIDRVRQVASWILTAVVAALCLYDEAFFPGFALIVLLRSDLYSKKMSDEIEARYRKLAIFGACYAAVVGVALLGFTLLLHQPLASWIGLRVIYIALWPFVLILALNECRLFRETLNNALQPTCEDARG